MFNSTFNNIKSVFSKPQMKPFTKAYLIDYVEKLVAVNNKSLDFFVAGGSLCDSELGKNFEDIKDLDVFFPTEDAFKLFKNNLKGCSLIIETDNAITYKHNDVDIQLVIKHFGTPEEIFNIIDLNKSKIAIDNKYNVYEHKHRHFDLFVDKHHFNAETPNRLVKYQEKGYLLPTLTIIDTTNFLLDNKDKNFDRYYNNGKHNTPNGLDLLEEFIYMLISNDNMFYVLEDIISKMKEVKLSDEKFIAFFKTLYDSKAVKKVLWNDLVCLSQIEAIHGSVWNEETDVNGIIRKYLGEENYLRVKTNYPEEFL